MNRDERDRLWDDCRDGALPLAQRQAFDEYMLNDREGASLWGEETRWLTMLKSVKLKASAGKETFTGRVLDQWQRDRERSAMRRRRWRAALFAGGWAAAAMVGLALWLAQDGAAPHQPSSDPSRVVSVSPPPHVSPMTVLVRDFSEQYQMQPAQVYNAVRDTREVLSVANAIRLISQPPAPADAGRNMLQ